MKALRHILIIFSNRYLLAAVAFIVWVVFFDENNMFVQRQRTQELLQLNKKVDYYHGEVVQARQELKDLENDPALLEKYAREKYFMKRDNEEVFIFDSTSIN